MECPKCKQLRKYFCYDCYLILGDISQIPQLKLEVKVDIIHHPKELKSKSTAMHARVIAPDDVTVHEFPDFPDYTQTKDEVLLLFPSTKAKFIEDMDITALQKVKKIVVVDSTWQQTKHILKDSKLQGLNCIKLHSHHTLFWRHQSFSEEYLSTIEATYYCIREYHTAISKSYNGEYDNLLFYFCYIYQLIQNYYKSNTQKSYTRQKKEGYIKYDK